MQACSDNYCFGQNLSYLRGGGERALKINVKVEFRLNDGSTIIVQTDFITFDEINTVD